MFKLKIKYFSFFSMGFAAFFLASCGSHVQIIQKSDYNAKIKKGANIYPVDTNSLASLKPIKLKADLNTRILFRDANKSNLSDALVFVEGAIDSAYDKKNTDKGLIAKGTPYYVLPRTIYGKTVDYNAATTIKTRSRNIGIIFNPYQLFFTLDRPRYIETNFQNRLKIGASYNWTYITHKFKGLNYSRSSVSVGPYFLLGTTAVSDVSINAVDTSSVTLLFKNQNVFGISFGANVNYAFNDFFGLGLLIGHERIYNPIKKVWTFQNNNISLGILFTFKFSKI